MTELEGVERDEFIKGIAVVTTKTIDELLKLADDFCVGRDSTVQYFAAVFKTMSEVSTFQKFERSEKSENV